MRKIMAILVMLVMVLGTSVSAFASTSYYPANYGYNNYGYGYNDPTGYTYNNGYYDNTYGYGYNNGYYGNGVYSGWRINYDNADLPVMPWVEAYEELIDRDISFGENPSGFITRDEVAAALSKALEEAFEREGRQFSNVYGVPYPDFTWSQDLWGVAGGLYQRKIMNGYPDGTFRGQNTITRDELAKVVCNTLGETGMNNRINIGFEFPDMKGRWSSQYASQCQALGIIKGYEDGTFRPDNKVTYQEFVVIMLRLSMLSENSRYAIDIDDMAYGITTSMNIDIEGYDFNEEYELSVVGTKTIYLAIGETETLKVKASPSDVELRKSDVEWESSKSGYVKLSDKSIENDRYATVDVKGLKEGKVKVTATLANSRYNDATVEYTIVITDEDYEYDDDETYVTSITLNPTSVELGVGESKAITATVKPSNATDKGITWKSHNTAVATVDQNGKITAKGIGNTTVTATADDGSGVIATIDVTVTAEEVIVDNKAPQVETTGAIVIKKDEIATITVTVYDENLASFDLKKSDILGMTGAGVSVNDIIKISDTEYQVKLLGVETAIGEVCVAAGVAVDEAGNRSEETDGVVIKVLAND